MARNTVGAALLLLAACFSDLGGTTGATSAASEMTGDGTGTPTSTTASESSTTGSSSWTSTESSTTDWTSTEGSTAGGSCSPPESPVECALCCAAAIPESSIFFVSLRECLCNVPTDPCNTACSPTLCAEEPIDDACYTCLADLEGCANSAMLACDDDLDCEDFLDCTSYLNDCYFDD